MGGNPIKGEIQSSSLRLPLTALQLLFTFLVIYHVRFADLMRPRDGLTFGLLFLTIVILCLLTSRLNTRRIVVFLTAANTAVLVNMTEDTRTIEPWLYLGYLLVMLMASFSPSTLQFFGLGGLLCTVYGMSVYWFGSQAAEHILLIPILLAMALVYGNKTSMVLEESKDSAQTEDRALPEAARDPLTVLPNRAEFIELVWRAIQCARNNQEFLFAVLFVDLDGFKPINDRLGHKARDAVLKETARRLYACLRKGDVVARYGGDEFTLLINKVTGKADAIRVAERVLRKVKDPIDVGQHVQVGASIGIALSTNIHERPEDLIRDADLAMYRAKAQGKGQYEVSDQLRDTKVPSGAGLKLRPPDTVSEVSH